MKPRSCFEGGSGHMRNNTGNGWEPQVRLCSPGTTVYRGEDHGVQVLFLEIGRVHWSP